MVVYPQFFTELPERRVIELSAVVGYEGPWDSESAYNHFPYEPSYILLRDCHEWFGFHPLGEIIDANDEEFQLSSSDGERSHDV